MYCSSCGTAISQGLKYCNRCGAQLVTTKEKETSLVESSEARLYEESVGLFWVTVIGLGLILGGMVVLKSLDFSWGLIVGYTILSSAAFTINFALSLWHIRRFAQISNEARALLNERQLNIANPLELSPPLEPIPSVTEHTTRGLDAATKMKQT